MPGETEPAACHGLPLLPGVSCAHPEVSAQGWPAAPAAEAASTDLDALEIPSSAVTQDYLKAIYTLGEWDQPGASASDLAARLGVGAPTVTEHVQRLAVAGLVNYQPYRRITLTAQGQQVALAMVRRHRLMETYLALRLGYSWDEVHDDAERLEHAVSPVLMQRIDANLDHPRRDPHGDPIPQADGTVVVPPAHRMDQVQPGTRVRVVRISDADPELLRELSAARVGLDVELEAAAAGLSAQAATAIWVVAA